MTKIAVIYYSSTGNVHELAGALAEGAEEAGAEVRLRRVPELAPAEAIASNPLWQAHVDATAGEVQEATPADLEWADGYAFGTPTRFGTPAAQMKQFIDTLGGLWFTGKLADKGATAFTSAQNVHGGNPYGVSNASGGKSATVTEAERAAARYQGRRLAEVSGKLAA